MAKRKNTKGQTMIYKTLHKKLKIEQHEATKTGVNSGAPEGWSVPAPNVANNTEYCENFMESQCIFISALDKLMYGFAARHIFRYVNGKLHLIHI